MDEHNPVAMPVWLWVLLPLLLAAALTIPLLDYDAFTGDEPNSLIVAGSLPTGPHSLEGVLATIAWRSPQQAHGWPVLLFVWGRIVGWSEPAVRMLPVLAGMLTLALVYCTGRDLFAPAAGVMAALLLAASGFFLGYMGHARAFTMVALCATLCLWCYWRVALRPRPPGRAAQAGLLLGACGLLYLHYIGALILPALGLFHLLFVAKTGRWWRATLLLAVAALVATPQLPVLLTGLGRTLSNEEVQSRILSSDELLALLLRFMSNGVLQPAPDLSGVLGILLLLAFVAATLQRLRQDRRGGVIWLPAFVSVAMLALVMAINERIGLVANTRIRYLIPLWPMTALLAGAGLWRLAATRRRLVAALLALWLLSGVWLSLATDFRYEIGYILRSDLHHAWRAVGEHVDATGAVILDHEAGFLDWRLFYFRMLEVPFVLYTRHRDDPLKHVNRLHADYPTLWLLFLTQDEARMEALGKVLGRVPCERALENWKITLERYALSAAHCPDSPARVAFDANIRLSDPELRIEERMLRLYAGLHSEDAGLLANYSLAVHVIDPLTGERVAQGDTGVGPGSFVPATSEIDISALPAGEYEVRVALYDWRTNVRLPGRDLETGAPGDMHTLHRFRVG